MLFHLIENFEVIKAMFFFPTHTGNYTIPSEYIAANHFDFRQFESLGKIKERKLR